MIYLTLFLLICSLVFSNQTSIDIQKEIDYINNEINNIDKEIELIGTEIDNNEISLNGLELEIKKLRNEIKIIELEIKQNDTKIIELENEIFKKETEKQIIINQINEKDQNIIIQKNEIERKKIDITIRKEKLAERLIHLYKYNNKDVMQELINSDLDFNLDLLYYLPLLVKEDKRLRDELNEEIANLEILNKTLELDITDLKNKKLSLNGTITVITEKLKTKQNLKDKKKNYYSSLGIEKKSKTNKINLKKKEINDLKEKSKSKKDDKDKYQNEIKKLFSNKNDALERERKLKTERNKKNKPTSEQFAKMKGRLDWPIKTKKEIINKFGIQMIGKIEIPNDGIDIKANEGTPVYPVLDGIVANITNLGPQLGELIIIDHGNKNYTIYANIKEITINVNDYVEMDTPIAKVANNPSNPEQEFLHLEIYHNEVLVNPEIWLNK